MKKYTTEFVISQYYQVSIDESRIDAHKKEWRADPEFVEKHFMWLHHLFQFIMADERLVRAVLEYQLLCHHDAERGDAGYVREHYTLSDEESRHFGFLDALIRVADCFQEDDKAKIEEFAAAAKRANKEGHDGYTLDEIEDCFYIEPSGFTIDPVHTHKEQQT